MRNHGNLTKWNEERGFGFIKPVGGAAEIFVHISAFPRDGRRPEMGELISYQTEEASDGKIRATSVMRAGRAMPPRHKNKRAHIDRSSGVAGNILTACALAAIAFVAYTHYFQETQTPVAAITSATSSSGMPYKCDGRTMCSEMRSCSEATYFLEHCPNTKMDGNGDGVPCEQQWCN
ncbi:cold shock domain-containing protein [Lysobacter ciconiae]|uniref:Cold shock domain-containing protein n=1 Tax=Novilysobacter ciconiae TaxID=2781022 RepID=A0A7S6ZT19_9GAMM|nr:cold shock domain-containing protein [Lysobacter ciconiae]QOW20450.1 cold shock domain-containing protein [Lysobacter ciconiae]